MSSNAALIDPGTDTVPTAARQPVAGGLVLAGAVLAGTAISLHLRGGGEDFAFLRRVADAPGQWLASHVLMAVGGIALAWGLPAVMRLVRGRGRVATRIGATLATIGAACTALGDFAHGALAYVLIDEVGIEQSLDIQKEFFFQPAFAGVTILGNLLPLGLVVLGVGLLRSKVVPGAAAVLVLLSPAAIQAGFSLTALPMPVMVLPFVVGLGFVAAALWRGDR
jgi:hypothetical protein